MDHPLNMRSSEQLTAKYENLKNRARKYAAVSKQYKETGGGSPKNDNDPILEMVIEILNKKTVYGEANRFDDDFTDVSLSKSLHESNATVRPKIIGERPGLFQITTQAIEPAEEVIIEEDDGNSVSFSLLPTSPLMIHDSANVLVDGETSHNSIQKETVNRKSKRKFKFTQKKATDLEKLAESKSEYYKQKARYFELECKLKEKDIQYRGLQIKLLEEELAQKKQRQTNRADLL